jgi:hypothetical protein
VADTPIRLHARSPASASPRELGIDVTTTIVKIESNLPPGRLPAAIDAAGFLSRDKPNHVRAREYTGNLALPLRVVYRTLKWLGQQRTDVAMNSTLSVEASVLPDGKLVVFVVFARGRAVQCSIHRDVLEQYFWAPIGANDARLLKAYTDGHRRIAAVVERKVLKVPGEPIRLTLHTFPIDGLTCHVSRRERQAIAIGSALSVRVCNAGSVPACSRPSADQR